MYAAIKNEHQNQFAGCYCLKMLPSRLSHKALTACAFIQVLYMRCIRFCLVRTTPPIGLAQANICFNVNGNACN